jgi:hypothetical protein
MNLSDIKKLVKDTPNDQELGSLLRLLFNNELSDIEQTELTEFEWIYFKKSKE